MTEPRAAFARLASASLTFGPSRAGVGDVEEHAPIYRLLDRVDAREGTFGVTFGGGAA